MADSVENNNKRHQEALDVVERFKQQGGKVQHFDVTRTKLSIRPKQVKKPIGHDLDE